MQKPMSAMTERALAEQLALGCRILAEQNIIDAYGHLSARMPDDPDHFMINRGMSPALAEAGDFIVCNQQGEVVRGDGHPNGEWPIHAAIYRARADVKSVLHSHSKMSRIFSLSHRKMRGLLTSSVPEWQGGVPVYRKPGLISSMEQGDEVAAVLCDHCAVLLRGHGDVVVGPSVRQAVLKAILLKQNEEVVHEVISHGGEIDLWSDAEVLQWKAPARFQISDAARSAMSDRVWDYYVARATDELPRARRPS
jgi:HCOMODA/2-hydroxy-3-carboxy-muconic semialdehyde decarboxylase